VARGAVVGGAGYAIGKKRGRKAKAAEEKEAYQEQDTMPPRQQPAPTARQPELSQEDTIEQLKKLGELRDSGVLTEEEFQKEKRKILGG
jgi:hypothetical protein